MIAIKVLIRWGLLLMTSAFLVCACGCKKCSQGEALDAASAEDNRPKKVKQPKKLVMPDEVPPPIDLSELPFVIDEEDPPEKSSKPRRVPRKRPSPLKLPRDLYHCGDDPFKHGGELNYKSTPPYICPKDLPEKPVCAYYRNLSSSNPNRIEKHTFKNRCILCVHYYSKNERWESKNFTMELLGYSRGKCK